MREEREPIATIHAAVESMRLYQAMYDVVPEGPARLGVRLLRAFDDRS